MKLIELFESATTYGWWISPDGTSYKVDSEGHKRFIIHNYEFFTDSKDLEFYETYDRAFYNSWVRLSVYVYGGRKHIAIEGRPSSLKKLSNPILDIAGSFNRAEVNVLSEEPGELANKLKYEGNDYHPFEMPAEMEDLEKYLQGKVSLREYTIEKVPSTYGITTVIKNPDQNSIHNLWNKMQFGSRALISKDDSTFYFWDGGEAIHVDILNGLDLNPRDYYKVMMDKGTEPGKWKVTFVDNRKAYSSKWLRRI